MSQLFKACLFVASILNFFTIAAASESAMAAQSIISLKERCAAVLIEHPEYLDPKSYAWNRADVQDYYRENGLRILDQLRSLWCSQKAHPMSVERHTEWSLAQAYDNNRAECATGLLNNTICLWNVIEGKPSHVLEGHKDMVTSVAYNHDGTQLASGSRDRAIRLWNPIKGTQSRVLKGHTRLVWALAYNHNGTQLASGSDDETIRIWNPIKGTYLRTLGGHTGWIRSITYSRDGVQLASGGYDGIIRLWNPANGAFLHAFQAHANWIRSLAYNHDGTQLASGSMDNSVRLWNPVNGTCLCIAKYTKPFDSVAYNHDGTQLAAGSEDGTVRIWRPADGACLRLLKEHVDSVISLAYNHDGTQLISGSDHGFLCMQPVLQESQLALLSYEERLGLFKALLTSKSNKHCISVAEKLPGLKIFFGLKAADSFKKVIAEKGDSSRSFCHIQ